MQLCSLNPRMTWTVFCHYDLNTMTESLTWYGILCHQYLLLLRNIEKSDCFLYNIIIGVSLSEPHTCGENPTKCLCTVIWYVHIPYMHSVLFVCDAIFPHVIHVKRYSYVWKPERSWMYDSLMESEERWERLRHRNQRKSDRHESTQQREAWLARRRVRDRAPHALWSAAQQERVLIHRRGWLTSETPDQRMTCLEHMSLVQQRRLIHDSNKMWTRQKESQEMKRATVCSY